jgi:hypothetical protein
MLDGLLLIVAGGVLLGCMADQVTVRTDPPGAKVYWDNTYVGDSPVTFNPPLNREAIFEEVHIVEAVKKGYMTGLGYVAERGGGGGLVNPAVDINLHEAPEWYISRQDDTPFVAAATETAAAPDGAAPDMPEPAGPERQNAAAERAGITIRGTDDSIDRVACDIRVVRIADGRVMCTVYGLTAPQRIIILAEQLAEQLCRRLPPDVHGQAVMVRLRNRRGSAEGEELAGQISKMIYREILYGGRLKLTEMIDLRNVVEPRMLDHSQIVTNPDVRKQCGEAAYLIQGGIAESRDPDDAVLDYNREEEKPEVRSQKTE